MSRGWSRRRFLETAAAAGVAARLPLSRAQAQAAPQSQASSPEITSGRVIPLLESNVTRPLRYQPIDVGYEIRNGRELFNRPLYGPNIPFRADGGDLPEFSLYLPGHGGNLRLGVHRGGQSKWLHACEHITMRYRAGRLEYEVRDPLLGDGVVQVEALTHGAALWVSVRSEGVGDGTSLRAAFGGVSGRKGKRNGDIGCEDEPVSSFFHLRPAECAGNVWALDPTGQGAEVQSGKLRLRVDSDRMAEWKLGDAGLWDADIDALWSVSAGQPALPLLLGSLPLTSAPVVIGVSVLEGAVLPAGQPAGLRPSRAAFEVRRRDLENLAGRVVSRTPDAFLDSSVSAMNVAADALWDETQGCVMHGAVAWRNPLAGWRGPYSLDVLGQHERMLRHLRRWIARQNTSPVTNGSGGEAAADGFRGIVNAKGEPDAGSHLARTENLLHSNGDLSHNHYDMNLVFFDVLLRHVRWTGDLEFAREAWPALERHAAWERRLFRREYGTAEKTAPLYEAYAAIWASDNLQYNGGGAAHSSAYNVYLNRGMAELAEQLGQPAEVIGAYRSEAAAIVRAMREHLWMPEAGALAESRDWLGDRVLAESPAVWTMYQALDSETLEPMEAWQAAADQLRRQRRVPVRGEGVPRDAGWLLPCSDWMPYVWSLTLLVMAEELGTALAFFQADMAEEGYALLRGTLIDAGFRGLCPGNFPMSLQLDPHRQESQRDFGDPLGCMTRVLVEGLWGVRPDLLRGTLSLRPQLPLAWERAELAHPEFQLRFERSGRSETWTIVSLFAQPLRLALELRGRSVELPVVRVNGAEVRCAFADEAIGEPRLVLPEATPAAMWRVEVTWHGLEPRTRSSDPLQLRVGERMIWPAGMHARAVRDPQRLLDEGHARGAGRGSVFLLQEHEACRYWLPLEVEVVAKAMVAAPRGDVFVEQSVAMKPLFNGHVRDILTRDYRSPRPGLCSLELPAGLLGGWADFDEKAAIDDSSVCKGDVPACFDAAAAPDAFNCCFLSHFTQDRPQATVSLEGMRGSRVSLLMAGTTFPQATRTCHAEVTIRYAAGADLRLELASPETWWPVEQDYLVDDFLFRTNPGSQPGVRVTHRVDLKTGRARDIRELTRPGARGGKVPGGSGFVVAIEVDGSRSLRDITVRVRPWGIVAAWMGVTVRTP